MPPPRGDRREAGALRGDDLDRWIATGDLDELLREVDRCCDRGRDDPGAWEDLIVLRDRARAAIDRGHQLWPAASWAEYRAALEAPAEVAARVVGEGAGYMAPGPLTEVVAQDHTWAELHRCLEGGPMRDLVSQERVLRGEDLSGPGGHEHREMPSRLLAWEPGYALAEYEPDAARFPAPPLPDLRGDAPSGRVLERSPDAADAARALGDSVRHWASHSEGSVAAIGVEGTAADAVASVLADEAGPGEPVLWAPIGLADAAALVAWAAASGGARGRRRGAATGRFEAWWAIAAVAAVEDRWPIDPGPEASELRWYRWSAGRAEVGWSCRLAVEDPVDGLAWALDATDRT